MPALPPGWSTDLAVLQLTGSTVEDRGDHLVVRTPDNPLFHWGNCLVVTDAGTVDDATRWVGTFHAAFPTAGWIAIGLARLPDDQDAWAGLDVQLELDEVLTTDVLPQQTPLPPGYRVRRIDGADWEQVVQNALDENARLAEYEPQAYEQFVRARTRGRIALSQRDDAAFFGAFAGDRLAADLGIVRCGTTARYQDVGTRADHRRRGLASHLLGVAALWAADRGCDRWVIVTEAANAAGRVYRRVGFQPDVGNAQAYRRPPR